jgi:hypothetical protein
LTPERADFGEKLLFGLGVFGHRSNPESARKVRLRPVSVNALLRFFLYFFSRR